jgi:hypothetical protein
MPLLYLFNAFVFIVKDFEFYVSYDQSCFAIAFLSIFCVDKFFFFFWNSVCILTIVIIVDLI